MIDINLKNNYLKDKATNDIMQYSVIGMAFAVAFPFLTILVGKNLLKLNVPQNMNCFNYLLLIGFVIGIVQLKVQNIFLSNKIIKGFNSIDSMFFKIMTLEDYVSFKIDKYKMTFIKKDIKITDHLILRYQKIYSIEKNNILKRKKTISITNNLFIMSDILSPFSFNKVSISSVGINYNKIIYPLIFQTTVCKLREDLQQNKDIEIYFQSETISLKPSQPEYRELKDSIVDISKKVSITFK